MDSLYTSYPNVITMSSLGKRSFVPSDSTLDEPESPSKDLDQPLAKGGDRSKENRSDQPPVGGSDQRDGLDQPPTGGSDQPVRLDQPLVKGGDRRRDMDQPLGEGDDQSPGLDQTPVGGSDQPEDTGDKRPFTQ